jgi:hypothetical protein
MINRLTSEAEVFHNGSNFTSAFMQLLTSAERQAEGGAPTSCLQFIRLPSLAQTGANRFEADRD